MSVARTKHCTVEYRWSLDMIPWYRQVISLIYGLGVILIALWALEQGSSPVVILGVVGMSLLTLLLIFGVEVDHVDIMDGRFHINFTETDDSPLRARSGRGDDENGDE